MNREAVALGTPVWTTFEGRLGAVDEALIAEGRLRRLDARGGRCTGKASGHAARERTRRDPAVLTDLLLSPIGGLQCRKPLAALESPRCAAGSAPRPFPSTATPCPRSRWTRVWSRCPTSSPTACASTAASPRATRTCSTARSRSRSAAASLIFTALRAVPALDALLVAARVPADRPGGGGVGDRARRLRRGRCSRSELLTREGFVGVSVPTGVLVLYGLLMLVLLGAVRYVAHLVYERPLRGYRARRGARSVLIVGAGDGGRLLLREILRNPDLGYRPVGFIDDDQRKQRRAHRPRARGARHDAGAPARARRRRARRGPDRDPVGAGHAARARRQRVPRARRPGPHDADRVRAAAERLAARAPGARRARGGHPRPRAGADGDRGDRRAT